MHKVWERFLEERIRHVRRVYHLWQLRMVLGRSYRTPSDLRHGSRTYEARGAFREEPPEGAVYGSLALMPVIIPQRVTFCAEGHKMFFRTAILPGQTNMIILGCEGDGCPHSVLIRLREMAEEYGIRTV